MSRFTYIIIVSIVLLAVTGSLLNATMVGFDHNGDARTASEGGNLPLSLDVDSDPLKLVYSALSESEQEGLDGIKEVLDKEDPVSVFAFSEGMPPLELLFTYGAGVQEVNVSDRANGVNPEPAFYETFFFQHKPPDSTGYYVNPFNTLRYSGSSWNYFRRTNPSFTSGRRGLGNFDYQYEPVKNPVKAFKPNPFMIIGFVVLGVVLYFVRSAWMFVVTGIVLIILIIGRFLGLY